MSNLVNYVFHYTGTMNQSYVMKTAESREVVFEAKCGGFALFSDTSFTFINHLTNTQVERKVGHTSTTSIDIASFDVKLNSSFNMDKEPVWNVIDDMGYGFRIGLGGSLVSYTVTHSGQEVGKISVAGTSAMDPKYEGTLAGDFPANGIYRVQCAPEDVEGFFYLCFAFAKAELALNQL